MDDLTDLYEEGRPGFINPLINRDVQIDLDPAN